MRNRENPAMTIIPLAVFQAFLAARTARTAREQAAIGGK
jgi:hypothetical protein